MRAILDHELDSVGGGLAPAVIVPIVTTAITWVGRTAATAIAAKSAQELAEKYYENEEKKRQEETRRQIEEIKRREQAPCRLENNPDPLYPAEIFMSNGW